MRELAILTAGGHAIDVGAQARDSGWSPVFYDDDPGIGNSFRWVERLVPLPMDALGMRSQDAVIGHNEPSIRANIAARFPNLVWQSLFHKSVIGWPETWGVGCVVASGAIFTERVTLGEHVHINVGATISQATTIGDFVTVSPGANVCGDITIGDRSWIGAGAIVKDHVSIGSDVLVGCGAVVVADIPDGAGKYVGAPARPLVAS